MSGAGYDSLSVCISSSVGGCLLMLALSGEITSWKKTCYTVKTDGLFQPLLVILNYKS